jgi:hypothetical protein
MSNVYIIWFSKCYGKSYFVEIPQKIKNIGQSAFFRTGGASVGSAAQPEFRHFSGSSFDDAFAFPVASRNRVE